MYARMPGSLLTTQGTLAACMIHSKIRTVLQIEISKSWNWIVEVGTLVLTSQVLVLYQ